MAFFDSAGVRAVCPLKLWYEYLPGCCDAVAVSDACHSKQQLQSVQLPREHRDIADVPVLLLYQQFHMLLLCVGIFLTITSFPQGAWTP